MNAIWAALLVGGVVHAGLSGQAGVVTRALAEGCAQAVRLSLELLGLLAFWSGLMGIADEAGLTRALARALIPVSRRLFSGVAPDSPAMGAVAFALSANMLGLGNAATPLGLRAMRELQRLNPTPDRASPAMCTLLALCTSSVTLVPTGVISLRAVAGASSPADILLPTLVATTYSTLVALVADGYFRSRLEATG